MADEQIVTNIVANADFSSLTSDLRRVTAQLATLQEQANATNKSLSNQISVMNRQFGDTLRSTGQFSSHFVTIGSDVEKFGKNLDAGRGKLKDFYGAWQQHHKQAGGLIRDLAKQQVQLQNSILQPLGRNADGMMKFAVHVPQGLDTIKNKTALAKQELMIMNKVVQEGANQLINWGKNTQWAGRQLTVGLTVPIAAFGKATADAFRQADEELTRLTKVYGDLAQTSTAQLKQVRKDVSDTAKELSSSMGASYKDTLALSADIAATGKTGNELLGSIKETTRLSILGEVDRQEAMKATLAIQSAFKQNTDELSQSIDFLNAVENQTSTSLSDLVEAIPKAGPVVKGLGGSIKDLALYLTAMREGGISASEGANALKSGLASLINPTNVAVNQFKAFGIDLLGIVNNNAGNVTGTLLELQKALDTLDPLSKQQAIEQLFGKFQFARMNALFENLGKQGSQTLKVLDLMKASSSDLADIAGRELSQVTESASGKYRRALESLKADLATTGEQFLKISTYVLQFVDKIINFANNLPGPLKTILGFFGGLTAIAGPLIMLTGVLGNFFGYIVKGVSHFKALFKGGEGWKLLTPEIMAATGAGELAEKTFYSDAKAAAVLNQALRDLTAQYDALATRAQSGAVSVTPLLGNIGDQVMGVSRVVDPTNPLAGAEGTRSSGHMVPRKIGQPGTIFGLVPTATPVNAAIGENPMVYANGEMENVPGLTSISATRTINGQKRTVPVSTGVVASEAARHHAYMAALAMQSKEEIAILKKTIATTGAASREFISTFDDILPITAQITNKAAAESAKIVADLKAGQLTVAQAREKIIALNLAIESELGVATSAYAARSGRTINLTQVPTLNQPVQTPTGKSNMRELFKSRQGGFFSKLAGLLGVRTSGAGYNIQTTIPRKNSGGPVEGFGSSKTTVSGPTSINYDDRLGSIPVGGFVLNQTASMDPANADLLKIAPYTFNSGGNITAALTPGETIFGAGLHKIPGLSDALEAANNGYRLGGKIRGFKKNYGRLNSNKNWSPKRVHITDYLSGLVLLLPDWINMGVNANGNGLTGREISSGIKEWVKGGVNPNVLLNAATSELGGDTVRSERRLGNALSELITQLESDRYADEIFGGKNNPFGFERLAKSIYTPAARGVSVNMSKAGGSANLFSAVSKIYTKRSNPVMTLDQAIDLGLVNKNKNGSSELGQLVQRTRGGRRWSWVSQGKTIGTDIPDYAKGTKLSQLLTTSGGFGKLLSKLLRRNNGGHIPGFINGGSILKQTAHTKSMIMKALGIGFGKNPVSQEWGVNSLALGMGNKLFGGSGLRPHTQNLVYNEFSKKLAEARPYGYYKSKDGKLLRGIEASEIDYLIRDAAHSVMLNHRKQISPIDIDIIKKKFSLSGKGSTPVTAAVRKQIFGYDSGGHIGNRAQRRAAARGTKNTAGGKLSSGLGTAQENADRGAYYRENNLFPQIKKPDIYGGLINEMKVSAANAQAKLTSIGKVAANAYLKTGIAVQNGQTKITSSIVGLGSKLSSAATGFGTSLKTAAAAIDLQMKSISAKGGLRASLNSAGWWPNQLMPGRGKGKLGTGMGTGIAGSMAGGAIGEKLGGNTGMLIGSIAGNFLPNLISKFGGFAGMASKILPTVIKIGKFIRAWSIPGAILTVIGILGKKLWDAHKAAEALGKANRLQFGGTAASFASVGIKNYKTLSDRLKDVNKQMQLHRAQVLSTYNSYSKNGPTGVTLTITQLDKAIKNAKKNQTEYVEGFNNIDKSRVEEYAASLKAQFVAMGMSASDAANQIYAIVKASNKSGQAVAAVSSQAFRAIQKNTDGIKFMAVALRKEINSNSFNAEEFATGLDTLLNSLMNYQTSITGTVDKTGELTGTVGATVDEADALAATMKQISAITGTNKDLSEDQLSKLKDQDIMYGAILGKTESLQSATAKILMYQAGLGNVVDLSKMGKQEAIDFANNLTIVQNAMNSITESTTDINPLKGLAVLIKKAEAEKGAAVTAAKKAKAADQEYYNNKFKLIDKTINKIKDEAAARIKLLEVEQKAIDYKDELRKAKLAYEQALASGDMVAAADAQANVSKLMQDRQRALTIQNIQDRADAAVKKKEEERQKLQDEMDKLNSQYNKIQANAATKTAELSQLQYYRDQLEAISLRARANGGVLTETDKKDVSNIIQEMKNAGGAVKKEAERLIAENPATSTYEGGGKPGKTTSFEQNLIDSLNSALSNTGNDIFDKAVSKFDKAVAAFVGKTDSTKSKVTVKTQSGAGTGGSGSVQTVSVTALKENGEKGTVNSTFIDSTGEEYRIKSITGDLAYVEPTTPVKKAKTYSPTGIRVNTFSYGEYSASFVQPSELKLIKGQKTTKGSTFIDNTGSKWKIDAAKDSNGQGYPVSRVYEYKDGGHVVGPGSGTSDSIPAMLSNGEYVINARSVKNVGIPMLENINRFASGGMVSSYGQQAADVLKSGRVGYANGGYVNSSSNNITIAPVINAAPGMDEKLVADMATRQVMRALEQHNTVSNLRMGTTRVVTNR